MSRSYSTKKVPSRAKMPTMASFTKTVWNYYNKHRRSFPWRENTSIYSVVVSEIMLQQTQAPRVIEKYNAFLTAFPDFQSLAHAPLRDVLALWKGLGYNRRALQLKKLADMVNSSAFPHDKDALMELPGIGSNTAGSIMAFAFNTPQAFIETNIRTVFIHFFFNRTRGKIDDKKILKLVEASLVGRNHTNPREWFYALMDYGVYLKKTFPNPSRKSKHHVKQSPFKGSNRELRATILQSIVETPRTRQEIIKHIKRKPSEIDKNLSALESEGFIIKKDRLYRIVA